ncbi:hypothetical protein C8J57DRAFT_1503573 [Mycena rebaudengoi]|nr:hypothetical protein C8J57DRAFT_1503573 [Mycena rebaudengoi]
MMRSAPHRTRSETTLSAQYHYERGYTLYTTTQIVLPPFFNRFHGFSRCGIAVRLQAVRSPQWSSILVLDIRYVLLRISLAFLPASPPRRTFSPFPSPHSIHPASTSARRTNANSTSLSFSSRLFLFLWSTRIDERATGAGLTLRAAPRAPATFDTPADLRAAPRALFATRWYRGCTLSRCARAARFTTARFVILLPTAELTWISRRTLLGARAHQCSSLPASSFYSQ